MASSRPLSRSLSRALSRLISGGLVGRENLEKVNANMFGGDHSGATGFATYTNTTSKASGSGESFRLHMDYVNPSSRASGQVYDLFGHSAGTGTGKAWLRTEGTGEDLFTFIGGSKRGHWPVTS